MTTVYVRNLRTDKDYELNLPCTEEKIDDFLDKHFDGGEDEYDEYIIVDCDDFTFDKLENLYGINEFIQLVEDEDVSYSCAQAILDWTQDIQEAISIIRKNDYCLYKGMYDMGDVAYEYLEETGLISELPDLLKRYFDYDAYGRDMDMSGSFIECDDGIIEIY